MKSNKIEVYIIQMQYIKNFEITIFDRNLIFLMRKEKLSEHTA